MTNDACPICLGKWGGAAKTQRDFSRGMRVQCDICGDFQIDANVVDDYLSKDMRQINDLLRAALSHFVRKSQANGVPSIQVDWFQRFLVDHPLPSPAQQATNIIRF